MAYCSFLQGNRRTLWLSVAEGDVRVRVRGRVVSVHRQRGQVRVVSVVTAEKTTNRPYSAAALSQPHQLAATPIRLPPLAAGLDFCFIGAGPPLYVNRKKSRRRFTHSPAAGAAEAARFRFCAGCRPQVFDFVSCGGCAHRCRRRCTRPRPRARSKRASPTGTGTSRQRSHRGGNHEPTSSLSEQHCL